MSQVITPSVSAYITRPPLNLPYIELHISLINVWLDMTGIEGTAGSAAVVASAASEVKKPRLFIEELLVVGDDYLTPIH